LEARALASLVTVSIDTGSVDAIRDELENNTWFDSERVMRARDDGSVLGAEGWRSIEHGLRIDDLVREQGGEDRIHVVEGEVDLSNGQYAFYLEPHCALVTPDGLGGYQVQSSTQAPSNVVDCVSHALGVNDSKVTCVAHRVGGGFGGKQLRAGPVAAMAAVCAKKANTPVKLQLSRAEDMTYCPGRTPVIATYRAAFKTSVREDGEAVPTVVALEVDVEGEAGFTQVILKYHLC
jgi:xanthine dehydrogenase molybdopterin-binding subunit B